MLTVVACPKPFVPPFDVIQERAIRNWLSLAPGVEVILFGDDAGTAEAAQRLGARHIPNLARTEEGGMLFSDLLEQASREASHELIAYVNADILLLPNLVSSAAALPFERFLMAGYRMDFPASPSHWDLDADLGEQLRRPEAVAELGVTMGCDYMVFRKGTWRNLPPLVIGRAGVENGLIHTAIKDGVPVVDATLSVTALHQFHDYSHIAGGRKTAFEGKDAEANLRYCGFIRPHPVDGGYQMVCGRIRTASMRGDWIRRGYVHRPALNESKAVYGVFRALHWLLRKTRLSLYRVPTADALIEAQLRTE